MLLKRFELLLFHHRARHAKQIVKMDKSLACRSRFVEGGGPEAPRWPPAKEWSLYTEIAMCTGGCTGGPPVLYRGVYRGAPCTCTGGPPVHVQGGTSRVQGGTSYRALSNHRGLRLDSSREIRGGIFDSITSCSLPVGSRYALRRCRGHTAWVFNTRWGQ